MAEYDAQPQYFPILGSTEARKLIFDFSQDLAELPGVTLSTILSVTFNTLPNLPSALADPNPSDIANGSAGFNSEFTQVIVPVDASQGIPGNDYVITVICQTTDPQTRMTLTGILSVR